MLYIALMFLAILWVKAGYLISRRIKPGISNYKRAVVLFLAHLGFLLLVLACAGVSLLLLPLRTDAQQAVGYFVAPFFVAVLGLIILRSWSRLNFYVRFHTVFPGPANVPSRLSALELYDLIRDYLRFYPGELKAVELAANVVSLSVGGIVIARAELDRRGTYEFFMHAVGEIQDRGLGNVSRSNLQGLEFFTAQNDLGIGIRPLIYR